MSNEEKNANWNEEEEETGKIKRPKSLLVTAT